MTRSLDADSKQAHIWARIHEWYDAALGSGKVSPEQMEHFVTSLPELETFLNATPPMEAPRALTAWLSDTINNKK